MSTITAKTETYKSYLLERSQARSMSELTLFPQYFEIETVHACNARCSMCTIHKWPERPIQMAQELFEKIAAEIIRHAKLVKRVSLYRDGEPLLDTDLPAKIQTLKQGGLREVAISTNGSLLTPERSENLLAAGIDMIIFSVDSLKEEVYAGIRNGLSLSRVLTNVFEFIRLRNQIRPQTLIRMRMIRQKSNYGEWPSYHAFWKKHLAANDRVYFNVINNWGGQLDNFEAVAPSWEPDLPCVAMWTLMPIFSNGDVPYCNVDFSNTSPLGNLQDSTITKLWQSEKMQRRREMQLNNGKKGLPLCRNCNAWDEPPDTASVSQRYVDTSSLKNAFGKS